MCALRPWLVWKRRDWVESLLFPLIVLCLCAIAQPVHRSLFVIHAPGGAAQIHLLSVFLLAGIAQYLAVIELAHKDLYVDRTKVSEV